MVEFVRSSSRERPNTAAALELFGQIDSVTPMTSEEGLTMRNLQHASRFNAWLTQQCSQWTNTMLPALRANDCPEHECVYAFFAHVHKMFNMPNLYRLSLEQLKGVKQTELVAGASYVLQFMQAHVVTMQLANRTGRSQWEFSHQACGDQLMQQILPEYLRQFLLVAAADEYFRECTRTGFPFIMEDVLGHKTFFNSARDNGQCFCCLGCIYCRQGVFACGSGQEAVRVLTAAAGDSIVWLSSAPRRAADNGTCRPGRRSLFV